jgi:hypothetical protein
LHDDAAAWVTVTVSPATVSRPVAGEDVTFFEAKYVTVPLPDPLAPPVIVSQVVLLVAVQLHPVPAVTLTENVPPAAGMDCDVGVMLYEQLVGAGCVIVTVCPATTSVPVRALVVVFCATLYETVPLPLPLAPFVIVIQFALLVAVHVHPPPLPTVTVAEPPVSGIVVDVGDTV